MKMALLLYRLICESKEEDTKWDIEDDIMIKFPRYTYTSLYFLDRQIHYYSWSIYSSMDLF